MNKWTFVATTILEESLLTQGMGYGIKLRKGTENSVNIVSYDFDRKVLKFNTNTVQ